MTEHSTTERPSTVVIGVGNRDRGDDAAGLLVADRVSDAGLGGLVTVMGVEGDLSDLALRWSPHHSVVIVDAAVTGAPPGTVHRWTNLPGPEERPLSSHGVSLADALELGRMLGRTARSIEIIGIEGRVFDLFCPPSSEVLRSVEAVAGLLIAHLANVASLAE